MPSCFPLPNRPTKLPPSAVRLGKLEPTDCRPYDSLWWGRISFAASRRGRCLVASQSQKVTGCPGVVHVLMTVATGGPLGRIDRGTAMGLNLSACSH